MGLQDRQIFEGDVPKQAPNWDAQNAPKSFYTFFFVTSKIFY